MSEPRYRRRKDDRPGEISDAAFAAFAENGYSATRVQDVAKRAGISKGLLYLYFKTKESLFKAVVRNVVVKRIDAIVDLLDQSELSSEDFLRGPCLDFMKQIPGSPVAIVIRLLLAEAPRHPELVEFYFDNVVARAMAAISHFLERGVERGEFRDSTVNEIPQVFLAPMMLSIIWRLLFSKHPIDTDRLMETQIEMIINHIKA